MSIIPGTTTEWDDIQIKLGNYQPSQSQISLEKIEAEKKEAENAIDYFVQEELNDIEDEDTFLRKYREKRMNELKTIIKYPKIIELTYDTFSIETHIDSPSSPCEDFVVIIVYSSLSAHSLKIVEDLKNGNFKEQQKVIKFCIGHVSRLLPDAPETVCPGVLIYHKNKCVHSQFHIVDFADLKRILVNYVPTFHNSVEEDEDEE